MRARIRTRPRIRPRIRAKLIRKVNNISNRQDLFEEYVALVTIFRIVQMISSAFDIKFHDKNKGMPPGACRPPKSNKKSRSDKNTKKM